MPILIRRLSPMPRTAFAACRPAVDDYLSKPFDPRELLLRIRSILKRSRTRHWLSQRVRVPSGRCRFNLARGELRRGEELVRLSSRERDNAALLAQRAGQGSPACELAVGGSEEERPQRRCSRSTGLRP
jgi:DNA-binding response OmpR family regulator